MDGAWMMQAWRCTKPDRAMCCTMWTCEQCGELMIPHSHLCLARGGGGTPRLLGRKLPPPPPAP